MPELPEVETVRRDLEPRLIGRVVTDVRVERGGDRLLQGVPLRTLRARLRGQRIAAVDRRGKYLVFLLDGGGVWVVHLRMTGSLRHRKVDAPPDSFLRAVVSLDDGHELRFTDIRKFGTFAVGDRVEALLPVMGVEPLTSDFTVEAFTMALQGRRTPLKSALLHQGIVAGIGNIYADEALFEAGLHPELPAGALRPAELDRLHAAIESVLRLGIENRGASFRDYTDADGAFGNQQYYVKVFRRTNDSCDVCGATIRRSVIGGRATHWCPKCQPARQARRTVRSARRRSVASG